MNGNSSWIEKIGTEEALWADAKLERSGWPSMIVFEYVQLRQLVRDGVPNVVNWRNSSIGHGVLKFQDNADYRQEVCRLISLLREYIHGAEEWSVNGLYREAYFACEISLRNVKCLRA